MKRTNLRRAVSGVLSVAMTASALFSDFSVPTNVFASDDTSVSSESSLDVCSDGDGSITSEYIVENLDEDLGEEAAALNEDAAYTVAEEYLTSELTDSLTDTETVEDTETVVDTETAVEAEEMLISTSSNDVGTSSNDVEAVTPSSNDADAVSETEPEETGEVTVSEEDIAALAEDILDSASDITTAEDYDVNGLAPTYHYIVLNYSLVDEDLIWDGITIDDLWIDAPDAFLASYLTYVNVYTLEDNEDYYVAFIDPASLNGLGSAIYADFTDLNTDDPTIYNDIITFDTETGLVYIPKSFYYNEDGEETQKELEAQVLVPYSFDTTNSNVSVTVSSEIDGVEGITGTSSVPTLDVTMTIQIVDADDADKISLDDISVIVNDDILPYDTTGDNAYYDTETGELTISASPNYVYSVKITIAEDIVEETLALIEQREILVASIGDLSGLIMADTYYNGEAYYATSASTMNSLSNKGVTVELNEGKLVAGQTISYTAAWAVDTTEQTTVSSSTMGQIISNTAEYSYYAVYETTDNYYAMEVDDDNWTQFFNSSGSVTLSSSTEAQALLRAYSSTIYSNTYNRIVTLPDDDILTSSTYGGYSSQTTWTTNISGNPSGYETFVAIHCVHNSQSAATGAVYSEKSTVTMRVLYAYEDSNGDGYFVFALNIPKSWSQAGSGVYKVNYTNGEEDVTEYTARFGINKVSASDNTKKLAATFSYYVGSSINDAGVKYLMSIFNSYAEDYENGEITEATLVAKLKTDGRSVYYSNTSGTTIKSLNSSNSTVLKNYDESDGNIYVIISEIIAPENYERKDGLWVLEITPGKKVNGVTQSTSKLVSVTYYYYDSSGTLKSKSESIVSGSATTFTVENEETDYYGALNLAKAEYGTGTYVGGAVYALLDYEGYSNSELNNFLSWAETASEASSATNAISSFYSSLKTNGYTDELEGVYTTSSSGSVKLKSVTTSGSTGDDKVLEFGSSNSKALILIEIYSPDGYGLDENIYCFALGANQNTSTTYATAAKKTQLLQDLGTMYSGLASLDDGGVTYSGNNTSATLVFTMEDKAYTSHTVTKDLTGTVTNELVKSVIVQLYRSTDGGTTYSATQYNATLSDDNDWTYKWENLPKYTSSGVEYKYKAVENIVLMSNQFDTGTATYSVSSSDIETVFTVTSTTADGQTTITNEIDTIDVPVKKDFYDTTASERIKSVVFELYRNNVATGETITLSTGNWSGTFEDLVKYDTTGTAYTYTVKETGVTYEDMWGVEHTVTSESVIETLFNPTVTTASDGTITVMNYFFTTSRYAVKVFGNDETSRLVRITTVLYADGKSMESLDMTTTLSDGNNWTSVNSKWTGLDFYDYTGSQITYTISETSATYVDSLGDEYTVDGSTLVKLFAPVYDSDGKTVTNYYKTVTYTIEKELSGTLANTLIKSVTVRLYRNGVATDKTYTLNSTKGWSYTWEGLDRYDSSGNEYEYTVKEETVEMNDQFFTGTSYTISETNLNKVFNVSTTTSDGQTTITNTIPPTYLNVEKQFDTYTEGRVTAVVVELYRNDEATGEKLTLSESNNWSDTFENLVKYDPDGNEYVYTAVETSVTYTDMWGEEHKVDDRSIIKKLFTVTEITSGETTTVTNTFNTVDHDVSKELLTDLTESLVTSVTTELFADNASLANVFGNIVLSDANSWSGTWEGLDEYDYKGNLITYTVDEIEVTMLDQFHKTVTNTVYEDNVNTVFDVDIEELAGETQIGDSVYTTPLYVEKQFGVDTKDRISEVVVTLYRNGEPVDYTLTLNENNNWSGVFTPLVKYDPDGNE